MQDPWGREDDGLPDFEGTPTSEQRLATPGSRARSRSRALTLTVVGAGVVALAIIALVLSQTVFRSVLSPDRPPSAAPTEGTASGHSEYIPDPNDPELAPPPPIFTQKPTTECLSNPDSFHMPSSSRTQRGGGIEITYPSSWDYPWGAANVAFMNDGTAYARHVEANWYSVVNIGRVWWPKEAGTYPGTEQAAITIFQCYATSGGLLDFFGERPNITDYRSEATTIDGAPAWIVQATYHFEKKQLSTTSASIVTSIVVETPKGPSMLVSDVAADHEDHVKELQDILASMKVIE